MFIQISLKNLVPSIFVSWQEISIRLSDKTLLGSINPNRFDQEICDEVAISHMAI